MGLLKESSEHETLIAAGIWFQICAATKPQSNKMYLVSCDAYGQCRSNTVASYVANGKVRKPDRIEQ